jgi:hypothetical protein
MLWVKSGNCQVFHLKLDFTAKMSYQYVTHPSQREYLPRLTIATSNPDTRALLIVRDADDDSELVRENWAISLSIAKDFGAF